MRFQKEVGEAGPWKDHPEVKAAPRDDLPSIEEYYDLLKPACSRLDMWHTVYNHVMASPAGDHRMVQRLLAAAVPVAA